MIAAKTLIWLLVIFATLVIGPVIAIFKSYAAVAPPPPQRDFRVRLLEAVLLAEARGEGPHGIRMVAEVIRNRARRDLTMAIYVVQKPKQFSCLNDKSAQQLIEDMEAERIPVETRNMAQRCAYILAFPENHGKAFTELNFNYARGATHYHAAGPKPLWAGGRKPVAAYKNHIFYKL